MSMQESSRPRPLQCLWCGREVVGAKLGRVKRYCRPACRQRAYEARHVLVGTKIDPESLILSPNEREALADRLYEVRCAAEDVHTAASESAASESAAEGDGGAAELVELAERLVELARAAERIR